MYDALVLIDSVVSIRIKRLAHGNKTRHSEVVHKTTSLQGFLDSVIDRRLGR